MNSKFGYYLRKVKTLPLRVVIKKVFCKIKNRGLYIIGKVSANIFGTAMTYAEFLKKIWSSKYQFNTSEKLQKYLRERKKPKLFIDLLKKEDAVSLIYEHFLDVQGDS